MKAYPPSSGLLFIVNTAHTKVVGRSWTDGLKNGTISTVFIKNTEGLWVVSILRSNAKGSRRVHV